MNKGAAAERRNEERCSVLRVIDPAGEAAAEPSSSSSSGGEGVREEKSPTEEEEDSTDTSLKGRVCECKCECKYFEENLFVCILRLFRDIY